MQLRILTAKHLNAGLMGKDLLPQLCICWLRTCAGAGIQLGLQGRLHLRCALRQCL